MGNPINDETASSLGMFFFKGDGPSHSSLSRAFKIAKLEVHDPYDESTQSPNKQQRVLAVCDAASKDAQKARTLVDRLLHDLRLQKVFDDPEKEDLVADLKSALLHAGWGLTDEGRLQSIGDIDLETGGRAALDEQLERLRRNLDDPAVLLGVSKELLEAIAKFILEEGGFPVAKKTGFAKLIYLAFERLQLLPAVVDVSVPGGEQIRSIYQSARTTTIAVNELRNLQGTGHGRTLPTGVTVEAARYVIRETTHVAELMLNTLDRQMGRS